MSDAHKAERVYGIFQSISQGYDKANTRISLGMEQGWKDLLVRRLCQAPQGGAVLDVCTGTGDIPHLTAHKRPDLTLTGLDFSPAMLAQAQAKCAGQNVRLVQGDAMALPFADGSFDAACISFGLRNTADYARVTAELCRVVKPGGWVYCLDSFVPQNPVIQPFYRFYFRCIMPLLGGGVHHRQQYRWLYQSTQMFLRPPELEQLFADAGLAPVGRQQRLFGACVLVWGKKQDSKTS